MTIVEHLDTDDVDLDLDSPAVLRGRVHDWVRAHDWSPAGLVTANPGCEIPVWVFVRGATLPACRIRTTFAAYVDAVTSGDLAALHDLAMALDGAADASPGDLAYYSGSIPFEALDPRCRDMADLATLPELGPGGRGVVVARNLWLGPTASTVGLHWDGRLGYLAQLVGTKSVALVSPDQRRWLYPEPHWEGPNSPVDLDAPDLVRHPRSRHVVVDRVELGPGDVLVIPAGWWHQIRASSEIAVSVNVWLDLGPR